MRNPIKRFDDFLNENESTETFDKWKEALKAYKNASDKNLHDKELSAVFRGSKMTARFIFRSISTQNLSLYNKDCADFGKEKVDALINNVLEITEKD